MAAIAATAHQSWSASGRHPATFLWNVYTNDLLSLVPEAKAFADDIMLSDIFGGGEEATTAVSKINITLRRVAASGHDWQVRPVTHSAKLLAVSWSSTTHREVARPRTKVR